MTFPAAISVSARVEAFDASDGVAASFQGQINVSGDQILTVNTPASHTNTPCSIDGSILSSGTGTMHVLFAAEIVGESGAIIRAGACGILWRMDL
jgi:hypothetical protein